MARINVLRTGVFRLLGRIVAVFCLLGTAPGAVQGSPSEMVCAAAAQRAASQTGVPLAVLMAVALTETGRGPASNPQPWPWSMNIAGRGHFLPDRDAALTLAHQTLSGGQPSFDVGCFQINYRWHGHHFSSLEEMMEPVANALYAAKFLSELFQETGDWSRAAGFYHSRTPEHSNRYRQIFERHYAGVTSRGVPNVADLPIVPVRDVREVRVVRENRFPLLQAREGTRATGSLVSLGGTSGGAFFGRPARPLWSG